MEKRMENRPRIGLALGSGGARGWSHIGVLRGLEALGVRPDVVAGTSMGALVGIAWAAGRLDALEAWARALTRAKFLRLMDVNFRSGGLVEARAITDMMTEIGIPERIEDLPIPFACIATDMETGREIWFTEGPAFPAVRASVGIPGVMSPVRYRDMWLLDGGLTNPVPVSAARALGGEAIIAVNPNAKPLGRIWHPVEKPQQDWGMSRFLPEGLLASLGANGTGAAPGPQKPNYFEVLTAAIDTMQDTILRARLAGDPPHLLLTAAFSDLTVLEMSRAAEAINEGHRMVRASEPQIRECILGEVPPGDGSPGWVF